MTDKEFNAQKHRVEKFLNKWIAPMGLKWFRLRIDWDRSYSGDNSVARTIYDRWMYREFDLTFYLPSVVGINDSELENVVVHELVHCLLAPVCSNLKGTDTNDDYRRDLVEMNTELVTAALNWVYQAGEDNGKKLIKEKK